MCLDGYDIGYRRLEDANVAGHRSATPTTPDPGGAQRVLPIEKSPEGSRNEGHDQVGGKAEHHDAESGSGQPG